MSKGRVVRPTASLRDDEEIRLFDRIRAVIPYPEMPIIVADEIGRMIDELPDLPEGESYPAEWYDIVAPPFKRFFVESRTHITAGDHDIPGIGKVHLDDTIVFRGTMVYNLSDLGMEDYIPDRFRRRIPDGTRWILATWCYLWSSDFRHLTTFPGAMYIHLDKDGRIFDDTRKIQVDSYLDGHVQMPPDMPAFSRRWGVKVFPPEGMANYAPFTLKAISAMHKRCAVDEVTPGREMRRRAERREQIALHKHYVLKVKPTPVGQSDDFRRVGTPGATERREHVVRGHFRIYGDRGLFGKYRNVTVWVPEHERGTDTFGEIDKDYRVE